jgi:hypothetical protein
LVAEAAAAAALLATEAAAADAVLVAQAAATAAAAAAAALQLANAAAGLCRSRLCSLLPLLCPPPLPFGTSPVPQVQNISKGRLSA